MSSDGDIAASVTRGTVRAIIDWTEEKVKLFAARLKNRELAFVEDVETILAATNQRKNPEWEIFKEFLKDEDLRILFQMGLTLRRLEKNKEKVEDLRHKILNKYKPKGLHIAQFIQNGFLPKFVANILERSSSREDLEFQIKNLFENIDNMSNFIRYYSDVEKRAEQTVTKIHAHSPRTFIICATKSAMKKCREVHEIVMKRIDNYDSELYQTDIKAIYFLNKIEKLD